MGEDGACLFRAVSDQVYGDQEMHSTVRKHCMDYIVSCESSTSVKNPFSLSVSLASHMLNWGMTCMVIQPSSNNFCFVVFSSFLQAANGDYFSQYMTEDFTAYVSRKRLENVHGNHIEMQAMSEMYNRHIEVFCYSIGIDL